jgi:hypothetical protein
MPPSSDPSPQAGASPVPSPENLAANYFSHGVEDAGRGGFRRWRTSLFGREDRRALSAYLDEQRHAGLLLIQAMHELEQRGKKDLASLANETQAAGSALTLRLGAMDQRLDVVDDHLSSAAEQLAAVDSHLQALVTEMHSSAERFQTENRNLLAKIDLVAAEIREVTSQGDRRFQGVEERLEATDQHLQGLIAEIHASAEQLAGMVQVADNAAANRLGIVSERVDAVSARLRDLLIELESATPLADPTYVQDTDDRGRPIIGYRSAAHEPPAGAPPQLFSPSESQVREHQRVYLDLLAAHGPVVCLQSGRGEILDLLAQAGIAAVGTEVDTALHAYSRSRGHELVCQEAITYVTSRKDASLGSIFASRFLERLSGRQVLDLLEVAFEKLEPDGRLVIEAINPHVIWVFKTFWADPAHRRQIFPETLVALCRRLGFAEAKIIFPGGSGELSVDRRKIETYALVAVKPSG